MTTLPAWAERTAGGRIRCTVCGNTADDLPVEHDCIYDNDLVADGGTPTDPDHNDAEWVKEEVVERARETGDVVASGAWVAWPVEGTDAIDVFRFDQRVRPGGGEPDAE